MNSEKIIAAPGCIYAFLFTLAAVMLSIPNPPRGRHLYRVFVRVLIPVCSGLFFYLTDLGIDELYFPLLIIALGMTGLIFALTCTMSWENILYFTFHAFILGEFAAAFSWQIWLFLQHVGLALHESGTALMLIVCALIGALTLSAAGLYVSHRRTEYVHFRPDRRILVSTALMALGIFLFSNISNLFRNTPFSGSTAFQINLIRMLVDAGGVLLLEAARANREEVRRSTELEIMQKLMEAQYANFQTSERSIALVHQKYHDLKHQIAWLREEMPAEEKKVCLDRMEEEIRAFEAGSNTGNHVLDTILTDKQLQCQAKGIRMTCVGDGKLLQFVDPMDLSALLGNLLDNAIEHASSLSDPGRRWIDMTIRKRLNFLVLTVSNGFEGELVMEDGLPRSTKGDDRFHGYGTKSVQSTAARYGGSASFAVRDGCFEAKVSFLQPE